MPWQIADLLDGFVLGLSKSEVNQSLKVSCFDSTLSQHASRIAARSATIAVQLGADTCRYDSEQYYCHFVVISETYGLPQCFVAAALS